MAVHTTPRHLPRRLPSLRAALGLDAVVTGANGAAYLVAAGPLGDSLGVPAGALRWIGAFLFAFAVAVALTARPAEPGRVAVAGVSAANASWVVASLGVLAAGAWSPTTAGSVWIALQAVTVAGFAALQLASRRAARAS